MPKFEDLKDGMNITIIDPIAKIKCVGVLEHIEQVNQFTAIWSISGFKSTAEIKDQSDVEIFKIETV